MALQTNPRSWNRVDGIDLLRGLSILFVLMNHVNMRLLGAKLAYTRGLPPQLVYALVWNGGFAVQMFFAISGYLITSTSIRRWGTPAALSPRGFYLLRIARIAPLLLLLIALLSTLHLAGVPGYIVSQKTGGLPRALLAALTFHINLLEATRDYLPANWDILWSLSVEEMFYLFFPLAARIFRRTRYLIPLLILFILAGPFARTATFNHNAVWREYSYLGGMDAIALGCLAAILLAHAKLTRAHQIACGLAGSTLLIFCFCFSLTAYRWGLGRTGLAATLVGLGVCLVIAAASQSQWKAPRILTPLLILGQRSYEIYLTHMFAVMALFAIFVHAGKPMRAIPLLFLGCIALAGALGWVVAVVFAEPMNRLIRSRTGEDARNIGAALPQVD